MAKPLYWSAETIGRLTGLVRAHNQVAETHKTRLQDLKKAAEAGFARGGMTKAWAAVDQHLDALRKADRAFDESKHSRDSQGRFTATGGGGAGGGGGTGGGGGPPAGPGAADPGSGGQRGFFADVATRRDHRALASENAGYGAHQTGVIPESRFTELYPYVGGAAAALLAGTGGAFPEGRRRLAAVNGKIAGTAARVVTLPFRALGAEAAEAGDGAVRWAMGRQPRSSEERRLRRERMRAVSGAAVARGTERIVRASSRAFNLPAEAVVRAGLARADARDASPAVRRLLRAAARARGGAVGAVFPGLVAGHGVTQAMQTAGPVLDAAFPRRVEKAVAQGGPLPKHPAVAEVEEALEKLSFSGVSRRLSGMAGSGLSRLRSAVAGMRAPKAPAAPKSFKARRVDAMARREMRAGGATMGRAGRIAVAGAGAAAVGGASAAAAAGAQRVYYRDEEGKFTSKDRAVTTGTAAAVGAIGGAIGAAMLLGRHNSNVAREAAQRLAASADGIATQAGERAKAKVLARQGQKAGQIEQEFEQRFAPFRQAASAGDPVTWTHHVLDRRAEDAVDALVRDPAFRRIDPGRRSAELGTLKARFAGMDDKTPAAARTALQDDIAEIEAATAARSQAKADFTAWVQGGRKGLRPADPAKTAYDLALEARKRGEADWVQQLPRAQRARVEAVYAQRDTAKSDFAARISGTSQAVTDAEAAHGTAKAAFEEATARFKARDAEAVAAQKAWGEIPDEPKAKRARDKAAAEFARLRGEADAIKTEVARAEAAVSQAGKALDAAKKAAAPKALQPAKDPWDADGALIPHTADDKALAAEETRIRTRLAGTTQQKLDSEVRRAETRARDIALAASAQLAARGSPANGVVAREIARMSGGLAPHLTRVRRDMKAAGSVISAAMGPGATRLVSYARKAVSSEKGKQLWTWVKANPAKAVLYASMASGASGVVGLDFRDDGTLNLSIAERKTLGETADTIRQRVQPVYRIWNAGTDQQLVLVGAVVDDGSGKKKFIHGSVTQGNGKSRPIPTGADLDEVLKNGKAGTFSAKSGGSMTGAREAAAVGSKENNERWAKISAEIERRGGFETFGEGLAEIRTRDGSLNQETFAGGQQLHQDEGQYKNAVFTAGEEAVARKGSFAGFTAGDWFQQARRIFEGTGTPMLRFPAMRDLVWGGGDGKPGLVPQAQLKQIDASLASGNRADFVAALRGTVTALPQWMPDRQWQEPMLLRTVAVLERYGAGRRREFELTDSERGALRSLVASRKANGGGGSSAAPFRDASPDAGEEIDARLERFNAAQVSGLNWLGEKYRDAFAVPYLNDTQEALVGRVYSHARQRRENAWINEGKDPHDDPDRFHELVMADALDMIRNPRARKAAVALELRKATAAALAKAAPYDETKHKRQPSGSDKGGEFAPKGGGASPGRQRGEAASTGAKPSEGKPKRQAPEAKPEQPGYFEPKRLGETVGSAVGGQVGWEIAQRFLPAPLRGAVVGARLAERIAAQIGGKALRRYAARFGIAGAGGVAGTLAGGAAGEATYGPGQVAPTFDPERPFSEEAARFSGNLVGETMLSQLGGASLPGRIAVGTVGQLAGEELAAAVHDMALRRFGPDVANRAAGAVAGPHRFS